MRQEPWHIQDWAVRWRYRFIAWFYDKPDTLSRRVFVENALLTAAKNGQVLSPEEMMSLALKLGTPTWYRRGRHGTNRPKQTR